MSAVAFDTLKLAEKLHGAGFTRKQASGAAEALSEALGESYSSKSAVTEAVETLGRAVDRRFNAVDTRLVSLEAGQTQIMSMLSKILEGQAVLHQNDMELKRRLDERS